MPAVTFPNPSHSAEWEVLIKDALQAHDDRAVTRALATTGGGGFFSALGQLRTPEQYGLLDRILPHLEQQEKADVLMAALMSGYLEVGRRVLYQDPQEDFRTKDLQHYAVGTLIVGTWANSRLPVDALADFLLEFDLVDPVWWRDNQPSFPQPIGGYPGEAGLIKLDHAMETRKQRLDLDDALPEAGTHPSSSPFRL